MIIIVIQLLSFKIFRVSAGPPPSGLEKAAESVGWILLVGILVWAASWGWHKVVVAIQLLEYQMVLALCRFDINLVHTVAPD